MSNYLSGSRDEIDRYRRSELLFWGLFVATLGAFAYTELTERFVLDRTEVEIEVEADGDADD